MVKYRNLIILESREIQGKLTPKLQKKHKSLSFRSIVLE